MIMMIIIHDNSYKNCPTGKRQVVAGAAATSSCPHFGHPTWRSRQPPAKGVTPCHLDEFEDGKRR